MENNKTDLKLMLPNGDGTYKEFVGSGTFIAISGKVYEVKGNNTLSV